MPRTKQTPTKSTGGYVPRHPLAPRTPKEPGPVEEHFFSEGSGMAGNAGYRLQDLMCEAGLGKGLRILYLSKKVVWPEWDEWSCEVQIYHEDKLLRKHFAPTSRCSRRKAEEDAAWEAFSGQAFALRRQLEGTRYEFVPRRVQGSSHFYRNHLYGAHNDSQVTRGLDVAVSLSVQMSKLQEDYQLAVDRLKKVEAENRKMKKMLEEDVSDYSEDEAQTPVSPVRRPAKRARTSAPAKDQPSTSKVVVDLEDGHDEEDEEKNDEEEAGYEGDAEAGNGGDDEEEEPMETEQLGSDE